jgi:glycosyltransferase involved in cell wall biosynthesis
MGNRWADGQTTITNRMAQVVHVPPERLWGTWPSGVTLATFTPAQQQRTWPTIADPIHLIYIGSLHYERNLINLCRAVEVANAAGMAFHLTLLGEGSERADLTQFAQQTSGRIQVLPSIPHAQVPQLLAQAHVGVLPFPDEEKFRVSSPIKLFEYMAAGLPILATRIVCHTDVIGDGDYVFWAESADVAGIYAALRNLWNRRERLPQQSRLAAAAAPAWSWHAAAKKLSRALVHGLEADGREYDTFRNTLLV